MRACVKTCFKSRSVWFGGALEKHVFLTTVPAAWFWRSILTAEAQLRAHSALRRFGSK